MTATGSVILLFFIAFFVLLGIRLLPVYIENFKIVSALKRAAENPGNIEKSVAEIRAGLDRSWGIDDVTAVSGSDVEVSREAGSLILSVEYEVREPMVGNIDLLVSFKEQVGAK
jgi:hypothetical protein